MNRLKGVIFTDLSYFYGFGRSAGAYRFASEYRKENVDVKVVTHLSKFSLEEVKSIIRNSKMRGAEWVGFSITFIMPKGSSSSDSLLDSDLSRDKENDSREEMICMTGFNLHEERQLVDYIGSLGMTVRIGGVGGIDISHLLGTKTKILDQRGQDIEKRFFKNFEFNKSQILWNKEDGILEGEDLPIEIARGCIFKCSFCGYHLTGKGLWEFTKSPEVIREEMIRNFDMFGTTGYMICDDTYNDSEEKISELLKMYKTLPFNLRFSSYLRFDLMTAKPHTQDMLYESGLRSAFFGIETFNKKAGKTVGKGMDPERIKKSLIDYRKKYPDTQIHISLIAGLPGETFDDFLDTLDFLEELKGGKPGVSWDMGTLMLTRQSPMKKNPEKFGITKIYDKYKWEREDMNYDDVRDFVRDNNHRTSTWDFHSFVGYNWMRNINLGDQVIGSYSRRNLKDVEYISKISNQYDEIYKSQILGM